MDIHWPTPGFNGRTFKLCVLNKWDFNFCVHGSPLRDAKKLLVTFWMNEDAWWSASSNPLSPPPHDDDYYDDGSYGCHDLEVHRERGEIWSVHCFPAQYTCTRKSKRICSVSPFFFQTATCRLRKVGLATSYGLSMLMVFLTGKNKRDKHHFSPSAASIESAIASPRLLMAMMIS